LRSAAAVAFTLEQVNVKSFSSEKFGTRQGIGAEQISEKSDLTQFCILAAFSVFCELLFRQLL